MDRTGNSGVPNTTPGRRDMMFCHECADEWYRDEHGLTCPECHSDFTEIIEENNDPRDSAMFADDDGEDGDHDSMPDLMQAPPRQNPQHNPWASDDPDETDISNLQFTQTAPGHFNVRATVTRSVSPQQFRAAGGIAPASIGGFMSMLTGLAGAAAQQGPGQTQGQGEGYFAGQNQNPNQSAFQEARSQSGDGQPQIRATRFTYSSGARLYSRDANNPEPRVEPVETMGDIMSGLLAAMGADAATMNAHAHHHGGAEGPFAGGANPNDSGGIFQLFTSLGMGGPGGNMGDFVHSQEGLDRIVSQLMEQTATSNAPPPAPQAAIDSLPRKHVDEEMLGAEHTAECSICMDEVNIGEEVTVLPCKHWFHHACVSAWLSEHDTCPHCRKGISQDQNAPPPSSPQPPRSRQMPGSFDDSSAPQDPPNATSSDTTTGSGGISDRIRRGLFGPQQ